MNAKGEELGQRLRLLRSAKGWSQTRTAEEAGIAQTVVSRLERGAGKQPTHDVIAALARAYGVTPGVLFGEEAIPLPEIASPSTSGGATALEDAVWREIDPSKHTRPEADAAQRLAVESRNYLQPGADVADLARRIVAATHALHKEGLPLTSVGIWTRVQTAGSLGAEEARTASNARTNAAADADLEEKGFDAEHRAKAAAAVKQRITDNATKGRRG